MVALIISFGLGVFTFLLYLIQSHYFENNILTAAVAAVSVMLVSFLLYQTIVEGYFEKRIRLIYKNIYNVKRGGPVREK